MHKRSRTMSPLPVVSLRFACVLVLAGIGFVCASAPKDQWAEDTKRENHRPELTELGQRTVRAACTGQGEPCSPVTSRCCGRMGCYDYGGGKCDPAEESCICRRRRYTVDYFIY